MYDLIPEHRTPARDAQNTFVQLAISLRTDGYSYDDVAQWTIADITAVLHDNVREPDGCATLPTAAGAGPNGTARLNALSLEFLDQLLHELFEVAPLAQHHALTSVMEGLAGKVYAEDMQGHNEVGQLVGQPPFSRDLHASSD